MLENHAPEAFSATQIFTWRLGDENDERDLGPKVYRIGFRDMQERRTRSNLLSQCNCESISNDDRIDTFQYLPGMDDRRSVYKYYKMWPPTVRADELQIGLQWDTSRESVFKKRRRLKSTSAEIICLFFVTENPGARWLQLNGLCKNRKLPFALRGPDCCLQCAGAALPVHDSKPTIVLL